MCACTHTGWSDSDTGTYQPVDIPVQGDTMLPPSTAKTDTVVAKPKPKLHFDTADDAILYMNNSPYASRYVSGILPHMATESLSYVTKLLNSDYPYFFIVDKEVMRVGVFDRYGQEVVSYGICCSRRYGTKHRRRDNRTPEGFFTVEGVYDSTNWLYTDDNGRTSQARGQFGPRFIRLLIPNTYSIGIHGTSSPRSIGHRYSHGCIRVTNDNIMDLIQYAQKGTPVIVSPSLRDQQVNKQEGAKIAKITMDPYGLYDVSEHSKPKEESKTATPSAPKPDTSALREHTPAQEEKTVEAAPPEEPTEAQLELE